MLFHLTLFELRHPGDDVVVGDVLAAVRLDEEVEFARGAGDVADGVQFLQHVAAGWHELLGVSFGADTTAEPEAADRDDGGDGSDGREAAYRARCEAADDALDFEAGVCGLGAEPHALAQVDDAADQREPGHEDDDGANGEHWAEVANHRHVGEMKHQETDRSGDDGHGERGAKTDERAVDCRFGGARSVRLLFGAAVNLDGEVDAEADEDRQAGDRHHRQRNADEAHEAEGGDASDEHGR